MLRYKAMLHREEIDGEWVYRMCVCVWVLQWAAFCLFFVPDRWMHGFPRPDLVVDFPRGRAVGRSIVHV